jgi:hypothetical protein
MFVRMQALLNAAIVKLGPTRQDQVCMQVVFLCACVNVVLYTMPLKRAFLLKTWRLMIEIMIHTHPRTRGCKFETKNKFWWDWACRSLGKSWLHLVPSWDLPDRFRSGFRFILGGQVKCHSHTSSVAYFTYVLVDKKKTELSEYNQIWPMRLPGWKTTMLRAL